MTRRILLTGGGGMVGSNFLEHPDIGDFEVIAPRSRELNLLDYAAVETYVKAVAPDMVIHAAGRVGGIQANLREPVLFLVENMDMGRNVVLAARAAEVGKLLNLGSSCMYPRNAPNPLREDVVLQGELEPTNEGYAIAKVVVARLCDYITRETPEFQYKTLIPCNIYGRHDKFDPSHSHLVAAIIQKLVKAKLEGNSTVDIWGDGLVRREFMYAGDLADALIEAVRRFDSLPQAMNVGVGTDFTINEYYTAVSEVVGFAGHFEHDLTKPVGMKQKLVSTQLLADWGWTAKTALKEGIAQTYEYFLSTQKP